MALISAGIFTACKKDTTDTIGIKMHKSMEEADLQEFEYYKPAESTVNEQLLTFTKYVNNPTENPMPNMELKEAVWFAETFFNVGVCEKQRFIAEQTDAKKTYTIAIPFEETDDGWILLKGEILQECYINLLRNVVMEICPEFSLNFGDVFVQSINADNTITLGLTVLYGAKAHKAYDEIGRPVIVTQNDRIYYYSAYPDPRTYTRSDFVFIPMSPDPWVKGLECCLRDNQMELLLNQRRISNVITNIIHYKEMTDLFTYGGGCSGSGAASGSCNCILSIHKHGLYSSCPLHETPLLTREEYREYAAIYREVIYNGYSMNGYNNSLVHDIPSGFSPLYACAFFLDYFPVSMDREQNIWQDFGIEYICDNSSFDLRSYAVKIIYEEEWFLKIVAVHER